MIRSVSMFSADVEFLLLFVLLLSGGEVISSLIGGGWHIFTLDQLRAKLRNSFKTSWFYFFFIFLLFVFAAKFEIKFLNLFLLFLCEMSKVIFLHKALLVLGKSLWWTQQGTGSGSGLRALTTVELIFHSTNFPYIPLLQRESFRHGQREEESFLLWGPLSVSVSVDSNTWGVTEAVQNRSACVCVIRQARNENEVAWLLTSLLMRNRTGAKFSHCPSVASNPQPPTHIYTLVTVVPGREKPWKLDHSNPASRSWMVKN